jgi:IS30 family transposase
MKMANHKWLSNNTGMDIFFARPYCPWERGTNENTNGFIRRSFSTGIYFRLVKKPKKLF